MGRSLLLAFSLSCAAALTTTATLNAQCVPFPGIGCFGDPPPVCLPKTPSCPLPPPSSACGFNIDCFGSPFSLPCIAPPVILFGACGGPVLIPPPIGCSPACALLPVPGWGTAPSPWNIGPGLPVGFTFCVQCGCLASDLAGRVCINLSDGLVITIMP